MNSNYYLLIKIQKQIMSLPQRGSSLVSVLYNKLSVQQTEKQKCKLHIHEYNQYICDVCERKDIIFCQQCILSHMQQQHERSDEVFVNYGKYINQMREKITKNILQMQSQYQTAKDFSLRQKEMSFSGKTGNFNQIKNFIIMSVNEGVENARKSAEEAFDQIKNNKIERVYRDYEQKIKQKISIIDCDEMGTVHSLEEFFSELEERMTEELNSDLKKGVEKCEKMYKGEIGKELSKLRWVFDGKEKEKDLFGEELQRIRVELEENKRISKDKVEKYKLQIKEKNKTIQKLQELMKNKESQIQLLYKELDRLKTHFQSHHNPKIQSPELQQYEEDYGLHQFDDINQGRRLTHSKSEDYLIDQPENGGKKGRKNLNSVERKGKKKSGKKNKIDTSSKN